VERYAGVRGEEEAYQEINHAQRVILGIGDIETFVFI
jgi:hypothetical protein